MEDSAFSFVRRSEMERPDSKVVVELATREQLLLPAEDRRVPLWARWIAASQRDKSPLLFKYDADSKRIVEVLLPQLRSTTAIIEDVQNNCIRLRSDMVASMPFVDTQRQQYPIWRKLLDDSLLSGRALYITANPISGEVMDIHAP